MKQRKKARTPRQRQTWPLPDGFELPDDVGLLIGNRIHRLPVSKQGLVVGGNLSTQQVIGEQQIHGDSHVSFGAAPETRPATSAPTGPIPKLTVQERQVAACLGEDVSVQQIGKSLGLTREAVLALVRGIQRKAGVRSRHAAVVALGRAGIAVTRGAG